ncbi:MAG: MBL fold metallo-hydrolase, partial [Selenomonas sp.]|nr:MBL fold metallo-hydrolase [Selenomonas sp.]
MQMKHRMAFLVSLLFLLSALFGGCAGASHETSTTAPVQQALTVKMLDIGQGDAILIQTAEQNVLIDTGDVDERDKLRAELDKAGVKKLDAVILTHPHADHIGGMEMLIDKYPIGIVYDNGMPSTSRVYIGYMKQLKAKGI